MHVYCVIILKEIVYPTLWDTLAGLMIKTWEQLEANNELDNYRGSQHIGRIGIEQSFEKDLHGITGFEEVETDAAGRSVRVISRTPPIPGNDLTLSLDIHLQEIAIKAFGDYRGALVAMDPMTGEILAFVSKPGFDANLFVGGIDHKNWELLNNSIDRPLNNRALRGLYPPGSTFKPFMALAALELEKRTPEYSISDPGFLASPAPSAVFVTGNLVVTAWLTCKNHSLSHAIHIITVWLMTWVSTISIHLLVNSG